MSVNYYLDSPDNEAGHPGGWVNARRTGPGPTSGPYAPTHTGSSAPAVPVGRALRLVQDALGPAVEYADADAAGRVVEALLDAGLLARPAEEAPR